MARDVRDSVMGISVFLLALMLLATSGCGSDGQGGSAQSSQNATYSTPSAWVRQATPHKRVAAVFVHGIFGDARDTWTNANGQTFFDLLAASPQLKTPVDVFAFGFTSEMFKSGSLSIGEAANAMEQTLTFNGVWDYETVIFVVHSMGGLVTLRELLSHADHRQKVPLILAYAVPFEGSQITVIAQYVVNNPAIKQMLAVNGNEYLKQASEDWASLDASKKPTVICAYETKPYGVMIVQWDSATRYCNDRPTAIQDTDHISIVKPDGPNHLSVMVAVNAVNQYVTTDGNVEMPDFQQDGSNWSYNLSDFAGRHSARLVNDSPRDVKYTVTGLSDSQLAIWPASTDAPREIPAHQTDELYIGILQGTVEKEYRFVLRIPPLADRSIVVKVADPKQIEAQRVAFNDRVARSVAGYLGQGNVPENLKHLPQEQLNLRMAQSAYAAVAQEAPNLPKSAQWVLAANALSEAQLGDTAIVALNQAKHESPGIALLPTTVHLEEIANTRKVDPSVVMGITPAKKLSPAEIAVRRLKFGH